MLRPFLFAAILLLISVNAFSAPAAQAPSSQIGPVRSNQDQLRAAVADSEKKLGTLEDWQKKIFDEEVVPNYLRFIRDYRPGAQGLNVDLDLDGIKKYMQFHASSLLAGGGSVNHLLIFEQVQPDCEKCTASRDELHKAVEVMIERRGFLPVWVKPEETAKSPSELVALKKALGALQLHWNALPSDPDDTVHADERHYQISVSILLKGRTADGSDSGVKGMVQHEGQLEVMEDERFLDAAARLLGVAFTEFGSKPILAAAGGVAADELLLELSGVRDFKHFSQLKFLIQGVLKTSFVEEKQVSRGKAVFSIRPFQAVNDVKQVLSGLRMDPGVLTVTEANARLIKAEIR